MLLESMKIAGTSTSSLDDLREELHLLEVGTFEIEDFADLGQGSLEIVSDSNCNCSSCSRYCSCSQVCV
jgi:hypothetical protein